LWCEGDLVTGFYARLREKQGYEEPFQVCVENVVRQIGELPSSLDGPGMLLGKIQSGKTRGFLAIIAKAFDEDFDIAIVLTKGTITLASQTVKRIAKDYKDFIENDEVSIFDIMEMPDKLTRAELRRKLIIVAKKQSKNLKRVLEIFEIKYPELCKRRVLLVDDEADLASVRFVKKKDSDKIEQGTIAQQMDTLRGIVKRIAFLQVTATPYSLYLQPETYPQPAGSNFLFKPKRPAFTELLPIHDRYVGGDDYFGDFDETDPRHYLYVEVPMEEQDALRSADGRVVRSDRLYTSENIRVLRLGLASFILAVAVRRWQQKRAELRLSKYAMVIHNDTQKQAHEWQWDIVTQLLDQFRDSAGTGDVRLRAIFDAAFVDISRSVTADRGDLPGVEEAYKLFLQIILDEDVHPERVNSDVDLKPLLDQETAELKLRAAGNVFIGGSILDRGITIPNLISFYYGRNPKRMQADTVLQHSRMYGARDRRDLAVTRFYTSQGVYDRLRRIHELEVALRQAFESGAHDRGVAFVRLDEARTITPCAPSKTMLSDLVTLRPGGRLLPFGFKSLPKPKIAKKLAELDAAIEPAWRDTTTPTAIECSAAHEIINGIKGTLDTTEIDWDWNAFHAAIDFFARTNTAPTEKDKLLVLAFTDRDISRVRQSGRFQNAPDTKQQRDIAEVHARRMPMLLLFRVNGAANQGWGGHPFWWPVLIAPHEAAPVVYSAQVGDAD
jgi:Z1 domain